MARFQQQKRITSPKKKVSLSTDEAHAWRVAHRMSREPEVVYVDAGRAHRQGGVHFYRNRRNGLYIASPIPSQFAMNLQPNFRHQLSAGGIPIIKGADGQYQVALIRVTRRSGVTWEVAKGKIEDGESPEATAVREVCEEMGLTVGLSIHSYVGTIRYGFMAPGRLPRLKKVFLYLMTPNAEIGDSFCPRAEEGIGDVKWFPLPEAVRAVTHSSLRPMMKRVQHLLERKDQTPMRGHS